MTVYYNEFDPFKAEWLRNLVEAGHIALGEVDQRSIVDVKAADLRGYRQCHFFAGIGVWSYALRLAGWSDIREVWTGSCPCQPFSVAGAKRGTEDERHLWPEFYRLIRECRPGCVVGEQVASPAALAWFDAVSANLESSDYAVGPADLPAASDGGSDRRQRLYWMAYTETRGQRIDGSTSRPRRHLDQLREIGRYGPREMANHQCDGLERDEYADAGQGEATVRRRPANGGTAPSVGIGPRTVANCNGREPSDSELQRGGRLMQLTPDPLAGFWGGSEWIECRPELPKYPKGRWRPVEPGTFPLAHGATARMGRLRAYGDAINAQVAKAFVESVMELV
jgi:DNA (cytosine-5)-methyltransferase 1